MTTFAIGDVQGCYDELRALLEKIAFRRAHDRLLFCGDLVNRGPRSLEVLRLVRDLDDAAVCVLGNHDLHLLAVAAGVYPRRRRDTFADVLAAPDCAELLDWLRGLPLIHVNDSPRMTVVHAGLLPGWDLTTAVALAREIERALRGASYPTLLGEMYGDEPALWRDDLEGGERLRCIANAMTRMRFCDAQGRMSLADKGPPGSQTPGFMPWYDLETRHTRGEPITFGHWSTLTLAPEEIERHRVYPLDTGCVWGGRLTALRLEDMRWFSVPAAMAYA
jgi:bis(5'-nucleosyl)-tetraphosphatase (symmetrical)